MSIISIFERFPTREDCITCLENAHWLGGNSVCPYCDSRNTAPCEEHLEGVMALMRASPNWDAFKRNLTQAYPKHKESIQLALGDEE